MYAGRGRRIRGGCVYAGRGAYTRVGAFTRAVVRIHSGCVYVPPRVYTGFCVYAPPAAQTQETTNRNVSVRWSRCACMCSRFRDVGFSHAVWCGWGTPIVTQYARRCDIVCCGAVGTRAGLRPPPLPSGRRPPPPPTTLRRLRRLRRLHRLHRLHRPSHPSRLRRLCRPRRPRRPCLCRLSKRRL
jgi:hypothetical protein